MGVMLLLLLLLLCKPLMPCVAASQFLSLVSVVPYKAETCFE